MVGPEAHHRSPERNTVAGMGQRTSAQLRAALDHPVIDADGHVIEVTQVLLEYVDQFGGPGMVDRYRGAPIKRQFRLQADDDYWTVDSGSWVWPTRNTLDRATTMLPSLYAERLDEFGIDFSLLYPSEGLFFPQLADEELRLVTCRAYNHYITDCYRPFKDRMTPAAVIPTHTPAEAVAELTYAVRELGMKVAVLRSYVNRPAVDGGPARLDFLALGSDYDYDPVWQACVDLGVAATFHSSAVYGGRAQIPNYVYNHIGILAAGGEAICKALFMGGVTQRFPTLNCAFLEGGVGWAVSLLADLVGHWERRSADHIGDVDPANLDVERLGTLLARHGDERVVAHIDELREMFGRAQPAVEQRDNFAAVPLHDADEMLDYFVAPFWFGCEADDPVVAHAFDRRVNPFGAALQAVLGSDAAHWDVVDIASVLNEAWHMVERGTMTETDFKDFVFTNPARLHAGMNPQFFTGTRVASAVEAAGLVSGSRRDGVTTRDRLGPGDAHEAVRRTALGAQRA
jgi:predicted TIM-barrel fold metal-dependent hydrolase